MAITERYVTQAAAGGGDGSSGNPWTVGEAVTHSLSNTGQRYNVQSDAGYSIGATTFGAGTFDAPNIWRGYNATIGDCDDLGRNADGTLNTTGMPAITITAQWTPASHMALQNLNMSGAISGGLIASIAVDSVEVINCQMENTQDNANARCLQLDDAIDLINSDFICSGATHDYIAQLDGSAWVENCRFEATASDDGLRVGIASVVSDSVFIKNGSVGGAGITLTGVSTSVNRFRVAHCTFYNLASGIVSAATHTGGFLTLYENHCTDCTQYVTNTTNIACFDIHSRTRDNTNPPSTVELVTVAGITTDTGGASTDYTNAGAGDFHLITSAPGYNAGWDGSDIGGLQTDPPAGGGAVPTFGPVSTAGPSFRGLA